ARRAQDLVPDHEVLAGTSAADPAIPGGRRMAGCAGRPCHETMTHPMRPSFASFLFATRVAVAGIAGIASTAGAAPGVEPTGRSAPRAAHIDLKQPDASRDGDSVTVDLTIDPDSWRWIGRRNVQPLLHVQLGRRGTERVYRITDPVTHLAIDADND